MKRGREGFLVFSEDAVKGNDFGLIGNDFGIAFNRLLLIDEVIGLSCRKVVVDQSLANTGRMNCFFGILRGFPFCGGVGNDVFRDNRVTSRTIVSI